MVEIPEHLLERSRAARARLTGQAAPPPGEGEAPAEAAAPEDAETAAASAAEAGAAGAPTAEGAGAGGAELETVGAGEAEAGAEPAPASEAETGAEPAPAGAPGEVGAAAGLAVPQPEGQLAPAGPLPAAAAVLAPLALPEDRPFVDLAFSPDPDSAARRYLVVSGLWLLMAVLWSLIPALEIVAPGFLGGVKAFSYGRIAPAAASLVLYGWLSLGAMAAIFFITPRVCGVRLYGERAANLSLWLWQLGLLAGVVSIQAGASTGREGLELPVWSAVPIEIGFLVTATCVVGTAVRRRERFLYPSVWYFAAAGILATLVFAVGNAPGFYGVNRLVVGAFFTQNIVGLWVGAAAVGAAYYVVPKVTGNPLYSHNLALISFWSLVFLHIWTGQSRLVYGPGPQFLQTVAIAFSVTLVVPAFTVAVNLAGTMRQRWPVLLSTPAAKFAITGTAFLVVGTVAGGLQSLRSMSQVVGLTSFIQGTDTLMLLGAFSMYLFAFAYYALPRITGRQWLSGTASAVHFWLSALGVSLAALALWGGGLSEGITWVAGVRGQGALTTFGDGFQASTNAVRLFLGGAFVGLAVFALAQAIFVGHLLASLSGIRTLRPESFVLEEAEAETEGAADGEGEAAAAAPELAEAEGEADTEEDEQARRSLPAGAAAVSGAAR